MVDVIDHKVLVQEDKMLNAEATISFFQKIEKAYPEKRGILIFCDNARYYRNKAVTKIPQNLKDTITLSAAVQPQSKPH